MGDDYRQREVRRVKKLGILLVACLGTTLAICGEYPAPVPRRIEATGNMDCLGILSSMVSEKNGEFVTDVHKSTDHLTIRRVKNNLEVTAHHTPPASITEESDSYQITADTRDYLSAVQRPKLLPVLHGLVINKRLGTAIWTESDSEFVFVSEQPGSDTVVLACSDVVPNKR
jgi:hypothetical protein